MHHQPQVRLISLEAIWEFQTRHRRLPTGKEGQKEEMFDIAEDLRKGLGVNEKAVPSIDDEIIRFAFDFANPPI